MVISLLEQNRTEHYSDLYKYIIYITVLMLKVSTEYRFEDLNINYYIAHVNIL